MTSEILDLLKKLEDNVMFRDFYFVGGTALSYYLNHRISYDLDFVSTVKLNSTLLKSLVIKYDAHFIPDVHASSFRINTGNRLDAYKMMFNIDGIKEFFYPNDPIRDQIVLEYKDKAISLNKNTKILPIEALAKLKLLALFRRNKIRDLFDIYALLDQKKISVEDIDIFYAMEIGKNTIIDFIEAFEDDGSESLDFEDKNIYHRLYAGLELEEKLRKIKNDFIDLIVTEELSKRKSMI